MSGGKTTFVNVPSSSVLKFRKYAGSEIGENETSALAMPLFSNTNLPSMLVGIRTISTISSFSAFNSNSFISSWVLLVSADTSYIVSKVYPNFCAFTSYELIGSVIRELGSVTHMFSAPVVSPSKFTKPSKGISLPKCSSYIIIATS